MTRNVTPGDLPHFLRFEREKLGLTQQDVAEHIAAKRTVITNVENGVYDIRIARLEQLAQALGYRVLIRFEPIRK